MAVPVGGTFPLVGKIVELFVAMGCEVHWLNGTLEGPDGNNKVRFLYNAETDGFASLSGLADDERIPWGQVDQMERSLGVEIPRGPGH